MTITHPAPSQAPPAALWFTPTWAPEGYGKLLDVVGPEWGGFVGLDAYAAGTPGVWLRHDVELSLRAAELMALAEKARGIRSTYFLCPESPLLRRSARGLVRTAEKLAGWGHDVGVHLVGDDHLDELPGWATTKHVSYHVPTEPGRPSDAPEAGVLHHLASTSQGGAVYRPVAAGLSAYASDSAGHWRRPEPWRRVDASVTQLQLLTHPYWWARDTDLPLVQLTGPVERFLPKAAARLRHRLSDTWQTSELPVTNRDA